MIISEINICDRVRPGQDPSGVHESMLDDIKREARRAAWRGITFTHYGFDKASGRVAIQAIAGTGPATLDALKLFAIEERRR
ncbi:hypothetical protein D5400_11630 [Georhizobium profundi]|uniref:Uncharacterized protein n=1 Tax=Georhizobium profundi TaxID=2341112 RepID=A0A3S9B4I3_9HYPH|nr:hypothetical protein [Georhizobium profundi]AZN71839.1 hypothetical protein D5400_11630 [Georhizobium profundi]